MDKSVRETAIDGQTYKIFPNDLNSNGTVFGGLVMSILDRTALVVAERHSESLCVTVSVDALNFLAPAKMGDILIFKAAVNRTWQSSMEIGIKVVAENVTTKDERHLVSAYFTFVAVDKLHKPIKVPHVVPETPLEKRRFEEADLRRQNRIQETAKRRERRKQS